MIIEFIGVPGSGKTSISAKAAELLADRGLTAHAETLNRYDGSGLGARLVATMANPGLSRVLGAGVRGKDWRARLAAGNRLVRRDRLRRRLPEGSLVDSGVLFAACGTARRMDLDAGMIASAVTWPDAVVHLQLAPAVALARVRRRSQPNLLQDLDDAEAFASLADYEGFITAVLAAVPVPCVTVRADVGDVDHVATAVADRLEPIMRRLEGTG